MTDVEKYTVESLGRIQLYLGMTMLQKMTNTADSTASFGLKMTDFFQGWLDSQDLVGNTTPEELRESFANLVREISEHKAAQ